MGEKSVSIVIPTYQRPLKLERAIDSALNQTFPNLEIIVVDDNNPGTLEREETEALMQKYKEISKVKYVKHKFNKNGSAARNTGFRHSTGDYIMFLDDDDEFLPNKAEAQINCLEERDDTWGACYTKYKRLKNGKLNTIGVESKEGNLYFEELCRNLFIQAGSNLMLTREAFEDIGGFDESFDRNQDIEFTVRLLKKYKLAYVNEMGLIHHMEPQKRFFDMEEITEHYISVFEKYINDLPKVKRDKFYKLINLQLFRYKLVNKRNYLEVLIMMKNKNVSIIDVLRYFLHLGYRRVFKKSYGFNI
ncbi:glycosyltransferase family 2 protein [Salimicrobium jeotgali]|uniref:glycosyltransferase family 2 protein n=1 Tax=Salimicrobium jeotgali TaxID=1230341 RepID=UPI000C856CA7|nr:glycosyltransferase family 2 protein [Salimicrobium jeotgali]